MSLLEGWTHPTLAHVDNQWRIYSDTGVAFVPLDKASPELLAMCPGARERQAPTAKLSRAKLKKLQVVEVLHVPDGATLLKVGQIIPASQLMYKPRRMPDGNLSGIVDCGVYVFKLI